MTDEERAIFGYLRSQGCCLRCCLRFVACRTANCYQNAVEYVKRVGYVDSEDLELEEEPCIVCLGVLQNKAREAIIEKIANEVREKNYDCKTFTCTLTIPISIRFRERSLHVYLAKECNLSDSASYSLQIKTQSIKDVWKWIVVPDIERATGKTADLTTPSPFLIEVFLVYSHDEEECKDILDKCKGPSNASNKQKRKCKDGGLSRKSVDVLMTEMTNEQFLSRFKSPLTKPSTFIDVEKVLCSHGSIFIGGRYAKLSRDLSQTPWFINGEKKKETSVQDLLCNPIAEYVKAQSMKFLSSGREDVDVRNIYSGRPFAVELIDPRMTDISQDFLNDLVNKINESTKQVQLTSDLKLLNRLDLKKLKEGENVKTKFYRALCVCRDKNGSRPQLGRLNELKNVKIIQKTPVRVLHRRPLAPRIRRIYEMRARWAEPHELKKILNTADESADMFFVVDVRTQAGTYVKEFVHGDFGRTKPSLCDLLNAEVDIIALDVTGINLNWP